MEVFEPDDILYVVGDEQSLHFRQLFALARALGYIDGAKAKHIGFGLVLSGGEKMSTRKGTLIELEELISQSIAKSKEILRQKNKELSETEIEEISEIVGLGRWSTTICANPARKIFLLTGTGCWILKAAAPFICNTVAASILF